MRDAEFVELRCAGRRGWSSLSTWREATMNGARLDNCRATILIALLFLAGQNRAKELLDGSSCEMERTLPDIIDPDCKEWIVWKRSAGQKNSLGPGGRKVDLAGRGN